MSLRIYRAKDYQEMSRKAANILSAQIILKPDCVLGLATGSTPVGAYQLLVERYEKGDLDFSEVTTVNLDEYRGLGPEDEQSYAYFMNAHLFGHVNLDRQKTFLPDGLAGDSRKACEDYEEMIRRTGGIDLQLLGLGHDGHIGFNEPADAFEKKTHLVDLAEQTIQANKRFFASKEDVPRQALTMGIQTIMSADRILLAVSGADKAAVLRDALFGPVTPQLPASVLQLHPQLMLVADEAALSLCEGAFKDE